MEAAGRDGKEPSIWVSRADRNHVIPRVWCDLRFSTIRLWLTIGKWIAYWSCLGDVARWFLGTRAPRPRLDWMGSMTRVHTALWQPSRLRSLIAWVAYPAFFAINRPSMAWFGDLLYDIALRCNGIAITFASEHGLTRAEEHFLERNKAKLQNGVLLDVGANHGAYARLLRVLAPTARIIAFEPHPSTFVTLRALLADLPSVELVNLAVGDEMGQLTLYDFRFSDGSTQASLNEEAVALYSDDIVSHSVDCTTIDDYMAGSGLDRIDFLKIDTEGHDLSVLKGARAALRERRIRMIQFEFIPANIATGATMHAFFEVLEGYRISRLCLNGDLRSLEPYDVKRCEIYVTHNLIAIPMDGED
jgi:FkbM family methyltransferase